MLVLDAYCKWIAVEDANTLIAFDLDGPCTIGLNSIQYMYIYTCIYDGPLCIAYAFIVVELHTLG